MWYKTAVKTPRFSKLELEALKYDNFEAFEHAYLSGHHGRYWHITDKENFELDPNYSPHDASSMVNSSDGNPGLMVTPHIDHWKPQLSGDRQYAVEVDLSKLQHPKDYFSHNRGFGREIYINNLKELKYSPSIPLPKALNQMRSYYRRLPNSPEKLKQVYESAWQKK
jgi:hypothetical protein